MTMTSKAEQAIRKARNQMICTDPFFASLALRLILKEDTSCQTMWTDGKYLGYNPDFTLSLTNDEVKGVIAHEVLHCANKHHIRMGARDHERWNIAADHSINYILEQAGYKLPKGALTGKQFGDQSAEQIYPHIPTPPKGGKGGGGIGEVRPMGNGDNKQPSASEQAEADNEWTMAVNAAEKAAKAMGKQICGAVRGMIEDIMESVVDWRDIVSRFVEQEVARNDYSWSRPNHRFLHQGFVLPSLHSHTLGKVAIAIDTSGSVSFEEVKEMIAEVIGILELYEEGGTCEPTLPVIYCDAEVNGVEHLGIYDTPNPQGGGGTDYRPVFRYLEEKLLEEERPKCLIYMTDGYCNRFPKSSPIPVLWALTQKNKQFRAPFGETLLMIRAQQ